MNNYFKGEKRTCPHCELKFYDLNRDKLECPRCKNEIIIESLKRKSTVSEVTFSNNKKKEEEIILKTSDQEDNDRENIDDETVEEDDNSTIVDID